MVFSSKILKKAFSFQGGLTLSPLPIQLTIIIFKINYNKHNINWKCNEKFENISQGFQLICEFLKIVIVSFLKMG